MTTPAENAELRRHVAGYAEVWLEAVELQRRRVLELSRPMPPQPPYEDNRAALEAELVLFAVALRNLIRAVEWASDFEPDPITQALDDFDAKVPHAVDIRDLLEHFDAYEQGRGNLQGGKPQKRKRKQQAPTIGDYAYSFVHDAEGTHLKFKGNLGLNVVKAADAAKQLGETTLTALSGM